uniref:Ferredoxin reductase of buprofezin dioxygenase n=2 Tax=Rhodococcus TaxID=1827 RepID=A0A221J3E8_RHOSG|nr:FAD-dependent oxidoreductase [Rhodococcus sp. JT-3]ASM60825.1 ferredoxin reductase of buprofezin dioxygenase [Rhodococcus qingshengii]
MSVILMPSSPSLGRIIRDPCPSRTHSPRAFQGSEASQLGHSMVHPRKIAIVGASAAGVSAAASMRRSGFDGEITLFDESARLPYERPPLSKSLTDNTVTLRGILPVETYRDLELNLRLGVRIDSLDAARRTLRLSDHADAAYDRVLLATGAVPRAIQVPGASLGNIQFLRTADDAARLSEHLSDGGPLVVVGAGFIGLELAAVAKEHGIDVTVVECGPLPLVGAVGTEVAELFLQLHSDHGVQLETNVSVAEFRGSHNVEEVVLTTGQVLPARTVVVGVGVTPNTDLARSAGLECEHGVPVNAVGRTENPWIWAAGDVAFWRHPQVRRSTRIEHWDTAQRHGAAVGQSMIGIDATDSSVPYAWSDQFGLTYQSFGRREPTDTVVLRHGYTADRFLAFWVSDGRVQAAGGIGQPRELRAARGLIEAQQVVDIAALQDPQTDLRALGARVGSASVVRAVTK